MPKKRPKIGLALSSGGARGIVHIAIIEEFLKAGIPIDIVTGSSAGATVAACYGLGTLPLLKKYLLLLKRRDVLNFFDVNASREGIVDGLAVQRELDLLTIGKNLNESTIPLGIVATDIESGKPVVFKKGPAAKIVRASMAFPIVFKPVQIGQRRFLDGGLSSFVTTRENYRLGADFVIGVNCALEQGGVFGKLVDKSNGKIKTLKEKIASVKKEQFKKLLQPSWLSLAANSLDILEHQAYHKNPPQCDYLINAKLDKLNTFSLFRAKEVLRIGHRLGAKAAPEVKKLLKQKYGI